MIFTDIGLLYIVYKIMFFKAKAFVLSKYFQPLSGPSAYNEFVFGASNYPAFPAYSEAVLDEFLFWPDIKDDRFIKTVYHTYLTGNVAV